MCSSTFSFCCCFYSTLYKTIKCTLFYFLFLFFYLKSWNQIGFQIDVRGKMHLVFHSIKPVDFGVDVHKKLQYNLCSIFIFYLFIYNHLIVWPFLVTEQMVVWENTCINTLSLVFLYNTWNEKVCYTLYFTVPLLHITCSYCTKNYNLCIITCN